MTRPPIEVTHPPQHEVQSSPSLQAWGKMVSPSLGHEHALGSSGGSPHHLRRTHQILDVDASERCGKRYLRLGQHRHHHARQQSDFTTALSSSSSTFLIARAMSSAVIWRAARKKAKGVHALVHGPDGTWNSPNTQSGSSSRGRSGESIAFPQIFLLKRPVGSLHRRFDHHRPRGSVQRLQLHPRDRRRQSRRLLRGERPHDRDGRSAQIGDLQQSIPPLVDESAAPLQRSLHLSSNVSCGGIIGTMCNTSSGAGCTSGVA